MRDQSDLGAAPEIGAVVKLCPRQPHAGDNHSRQTDLGTPGCRRERLVYSVPACHVRQNVLEQRNAYWCQIEVIIWVVEDLPAVNGLLN